MALSNSTHLLCEYLIFSEGKEDLSSQQRKKEKKRLQLFLFACVFLPCILTAERRNYLLSLYQNLANVDQCEAAENNGFSSFPNYRLSCNLSERQQGKHFCLAHPSAQPVCSSISSGFLRKRHESTGAQGDQITEVNSHGMV